MKTTRFFVERRDIDAAINMYKLGKRVSEIAKEFKCNPTTVSDMLKREGAHKCLSERLLINKLVITDEQKQRIKTLNSERKSFGFISDELKIPLHYVRKCSKELKLKPLSYSECNLQYWTNHSWLDSIDSPEKAIFLGLFFADGCNSSNDNTISICLHAKDEQYLEGFRKMITETPMKLERHKLPKEYRTLVACSKRLSERLSELGAVPKKSLVLKWPTSIPKEMERFFIRGYFEGDGGISVKNTKSGIRHEVSFAGTKDFIESLNKALLETLGFEGKIYPNGNIHQLFIFKKEYMKRFLSWIYQDYENIAMQRKLKIAKLILFPELHL